MSAGNGMAHPPFAFAVWVAVGLTENHTIDCHCHADEREGVRASGHSKAWERHVFAILARMDRLWTPWRYAYITKTAPMRPGVPEALDAWPGPQSGEHDCVFCNMIHAVDYAVANGMAREEAEREALIVSRGATTFLCLNRYPYSTGHVMVVPYAHTDSLASLAPETAQEMMATAQRVEAMLRSVYRPQGLNFGLNLGEAAGAGVAAHLHLHALPRWSGDTNFMTVTAETRVLPEMLETTWQRLRDCVQADTD